MIRVQGTIVALKNYQNYVKIIKICLKACSYSFFLRIKHIIILKIKNIGIILLK